MFGLDVIATSSSFGIPGQKGLDWTAMDIQQFVTGCVSAVQQEAAECDGVPEDSEEAGVSSIVSSTEQQAGQGGPATARQAIVWVEDQNSAGDQLGLNISASSSSSQAPYDQMVDNLTIHYQPPRCSSKLYITSNNTERSLQLPGSFHLFLTLANTKIVVGYFMVDTELMYPSDSMVCQAVISKLPSPLLTWKDKQEVAYRSGLPEVFSEGRGKLSTCPEVESNPGPRYDI